MKKQIRNILNKIGLPLKFSMVIFGILCVTAFISGFLMNVIMATGFFSKHIIKDYRIIPVTTLIACIIIGTILAVLASKSTVRTVDKFIKASNQLANGDFTARIKVCHPREFKMMAENFNHMAKELGSIEVLRSDFINNFSHEFKTPIVSIKGFAEILKYDDLTPKEREEYLDIVIQESSRLAVLASNVLEVSKIEQQAILTDKQIFNLGEQIRRCVLLLENEISQKEIELHLNINDYKIQGNQEMMSQVWVNLLNNAVKFTEEKGNIYINMKKEDKKVIVEIKDDGCGISEEAMPKIFDKFYQADTSHATRGNGLGLSIVKKILELHSADISCKSQALKGTCFTIALKETLPDKTI